MTERLPIDTLDLSEVSKCRHEVREAAVERYAAMLAEDDSGWPFDSKINVARIDDRNIVVDGMHRVLAAQKAGLRSIIADRWEAKDLDEVIRAARSANTRHGEMLTKAERMDNLREYLAHGGAKQKDTEIARLMGVHRKTVARFREELGLGNGKREREGVRPVQPPKALEPPPAPKPTTKNGTKCHISADVHAEEPPKTVLPAVSVTDSVGKEIPPEFWERHRRMESVVEEALQTVARLKSFITELQTEDLRAFPHKSIAVNLTAATDSIRAGLKDIKPECLCTCNGDGCRRCGGVGFLSLARYNAIVPEEER